VNGHDQFPSSCLSLRTVTCNQLLFCTDFWKIYIPHIGHNTIKGSSAQKGIYLHTTYNGINTTRNVRINVTFRHVRVTAVEVEKQVLQILRACVCLTLVIQHALGMRHFAIFSQSDSTILFHISSLMTRLSEEKLRDKKMRVLSLPTTWFSNISHANLNSVKYHMCTYVIVLYTHYACQIFMKPELSRQFSKSNRTSNFMSMRPVRADVLHVDGQTWRSY